MFPIVGNGPKGDIKGTQKSLSQHFDQWSLSRPDEMLRDPTISVVIPLYNKGPHVRRALESVLSQTLQDFEVIVIDDGSTDYGASIVRDICDPRICLIQQNNQGVSAARNRGVHESRAELIAFLDADDEWSEDHLETLMRLRKTWPEAGAYATAYVKMAGGISARPKFPRKEIPRRPWEGLIPNYFMAVSKGDTVMTSSTVAIPKTVLGELGGFAADVDRGEDTDLWGRIALRYPIAFSWEGRGAYHIDATNRACNIHSPIFDRAFYRSARSALQEGDLPANLEEGLLEYISTLQLRSAYQNLVAGRPDLALDNLDRCTSQRLKVKKHLVMMWANLPDRIVQALCRIKNEMSPD